MCPSCGSCDYACNLIDEAPYRSAALAAAELRRLGDRGSVVEILSRLAGVRIANFLRLRWRCLSCGVTYND